MHTPIAIHTARALGAVLLTAGLLLLSQGAAQAQSTEVRLTGDNANNFFIVRALDANTLEFCTDLIPCFTRSRSSVQRVVLDGLDGDDGVFIQHGTTFVSNPDVPLNLTFTGGVGSDELRICAIPGEACTTFQTTDVSVLPETDEVRIVQCLDRTQHGTRCTDVPFQQPVPTLKINVRGADVVTDQSRGPATVLGTPDGNAITYGDGESFTNTDPLGLDTTTGAVSVDNHATYQMLNKDNLTIDAGAGPDTILLRSRAGFGADTTSCARDGAAAGAPLCVVAGEESGDRVEAPNGAAGEAVSLTTRVSDTARLAGLAIPAVADLHGVDMLSIPLAPSQNDSFTLYGTPVDDAFAFDVTTADVMVITGNLATNTPVPAPVPMIRLHGDGTGPLAVTLDALAGADVVTGTTGVADDDVSAAPAPGTCFGPSGTCLRVATGPHDHSRVTVGAERVDLVTGDGTDTLLVTGDLATDLHWAGGSGPDTLGFAGTGAPVTADLGAGTVAQSAGAGGVTVTEVEAWDVDVADSNLIAIGTSGADALRYAPVDATSATISLDGSATTVRASGVAGTMTLDPAAGDDTVIVDGTTTDDSIAVFRGTTVTAQIGDTLPGRASADTESIRIDGRSGDDRFLLNGAGGPTAITLDGGLDTGGDRVSFVAAVSSATVAFAAAPSAGTLQADGPPIAFVGVEHVDAEGDDNGTFTVNGSDTDDVLVQDGNTVTAGRGTTASFTRYPTLALQGLAGNDDAVLSPRGLWGVSAVVVDGGDAGTDTLTVLGSTLRETIAYTPDGVHSGAVEVSLAAPVTFVGVEDVEVDGRTAPPSGDTLLVRSPVHDGTIEVQPGAAVDAGTVGLVGTTGGPTSFPSLHFGGLGRGSVVIDGADGAATPADSVRVLGQPDADVMDVQGDGTGGTSVVLDGRIPVVTTAVHTVQLHTRDGQDTVHLPTTHGLVGASGPAIQIDGGGPSGGDVAVIRAADQSVVVDLSARTVAEVGQRPIAFSGLDRIDLDAAGNATTILGGDGPDAVTARPTGPAAARLASDLVATQVHLSAAGSLTVDTAGGADALTVVGRTVGEDIAVTRGTRPRVAVADLLPVVVTDAVEALSVDGREGADVLVVDGDGGPSSLSLLGGTPAGDGDVVRLLAPDAGVTFGDPPSGGSLDSPGGTLTFDGVDVIDVGGDGSGALTVRGTDAPDTITLGDPGTPAVRVNGGAAVTHVGYPSLRLESRGGADTVDVSYTNLGDLLAIDVVGGTAGDDRVRVIDATGTTRSWQVSPTDGDVALVTADGAVPSLHASGVADVVLDGRGVDDRLQVLTPDGAQDVVVVPGPAADRATIRVGQLVPVTATGMGVDGLLEVNAAGDEQLDHVLLEGTAAADRVRVTGSDDGVRMDGAPDLLAHGATALTVRAYAGDDELVATGPLPWTTTTFEGGTGSDRVALDGPVGDAVVDLDRASITGYGGTVVVPEVEDLETRHATAGLTMLGTGSDDAMCVDPLTPRDGRVHVIASPNSGLDGDSCAPTPGSPSILHTFVDVGLLLLDPGVGADQVLINGTVEDDAVVVTSDGTEVVVTVHPNPASTAEVRLPVHVASATTEHLIVATDAGQDDVDVRLLEALAPTLTIHGESPDSRNADHLTVRDLSGGSNVNNINGDPQSSGTVVVEWRRFSGIRIDVNYTGMERVRTYKSQRPKSQTVNGRQLGHG